MLLLHKAPVLASTCQLHYALVMTLGTLVILPSLQWSDGRHDNEAEEP